MSDTVIDSVDQ